MPLAPTATRVATNTASAVNRDIQLRTVRDIQRHGDENRADIGRRLLELQREWDVERAIETEAPLMILAGVALSAFVDRRFAALSSFAASMLLLHNLQGWYPLLPLLRRAGMRTSREIADEAYALKVRRGDFDALRETGADEGRAAQAYAAAAWE